MLGDREQAKPGGQAFVESQSPISQTEAHEDGGTEERLESPDSMLRFTQSHSVHRE